MLLSVFAVYIYRHEHLLGSNSGPAGSLQVLLMGSNTPPTHSRTYRVLSSWQTM